MKLYFEIPDAEGLCAVCITVFLYLKLCLVDTQEGTLEPFLFHPLSKLVSRRIGIKHINRHVSSVIHTMAHVVFFRLNQPTSPALGRKTKFLSFWLRW